MNEMEDGVMEKSKKKLFDKIAPIYGMFYEIQRKNYAFVPEMMEKEGIFAPMQILDLGCGTGALLSVLEHAGYQVTGVDPARDMLKVAMWKTRKQNIRFHHLKNPARLPFEDNSFDAVISSYVLHGMPEEERRILYEEMKRVSRRKVIIHDFNEKRALHISVVEYLEKGDYFRFIKVARKEMSEVFGEVKMTHVGKNAAWYVMNVKGPRIHADQ
jgi:ubiquinone/menaquinone biosynthesis C-methylase UbiE